MIRLLPIVEGYGELRAVPLLLRRILERTQRYDGHVLSAHRRGEWPRVRKEFDRYYAAALNECDRILWLMDYDCDGCDDPMRDARWMSERAAALDSRGSLECAFLVMEFESLFLWQTNPLRAVFPDLRRPFELPSEPESVRDAKGSISVMLPKGSMYKPTIHQERLVAHLDLDHLNEVSPSFKRLLAAVSALIEVR
jgi:hypothetical protein